MRRALAFLPLLLAACVDLSAPVDERRFYALAAERPGIAKDGPAATVLKVRSFRISRAYEGAEFVYRASDAVYESDFYHGFFTPPAAQVTEAARRWLAAAGLFGHVVEAASVAPDTHLLEGHVAALYADLRSTPKAVLELQLTLLKSSGEIRLQKTLRREIEAASSAPDALVAAWNRALGEVLWDAESALASAVK